MVRYFKKEIPENHLYLPNGRRCPFRVSKSGVGILATNDQGLVGELDKVLARHAGGLIEIPELEYLLLRDGRSQPQPDNRQHQRNGEDERELVGIDQLYIKWKIAKGRTVFRPVKTGIRTVGKFIHVLERHRQPDADSERRVTNAFWSWAYHYERGMLPCHVWEYPRSARTIGDPRDLPYLKDVLQEGLKMAAQPDDILLLTNDDTVLHRRIVSALTTMLKRGVDAVSSFRINFEREDMPATDTPVAKIRQWGEACLGRDLFAFRAEWLKLNWNAIPDFLLGELEWDLVLATMVRCAAEVMTTKMNLSIQQPKCELDRGYVIHENHARNWTNERFAKAPAKIHNNRHMAEFFADNGFEGLIGKLI